MKSKSLIIILLSSLSLATSYAQEAAYTKLKIEDTKNVYILSGKELYRSGQPDDEGFEDLEKKGLKSSLSLREYHSDKDEAEDTDIKLYHYKLAAGSVTEEELLDCLKIIQAAPKPILVHCWHGSDRTGVVCAAYRIAVQNWKIEDAIKEFTDGPFGFHETFYGNLPKLLKDIDWVAFKKKLAAAAKPVATQKPAQ